MSTSEYPARVGGAWLPRMLAAVRARPIAADVWILAALIAVAAVIRLLVINNQSFWMDEALTSYETRIPFGAMINTVVHVETTPPLYFVLVWFWAHIFGSGEVALRIVSVLAGIALVPIAYLAARELVSRWAGTVAAALVAINPFLIWYSQEARAYMLLAALSGASFLWFVRARREPSPRNLTWWAIWSSLALMTHFFAGFLVAPEALWLLWISRARRVWTAVGVVAVVQAAMLPFAAIDTNAAHGAGWIATIPKLQRVAGAVAEWGVSILYRRATTAEALGLGALLLVLVALLVFRRGDRRTQEGVAVAAVIAGIVWVAPLVAGYLGQDYFLSRNVIPAVVPVAVLLAGACVLPRARLLGGALAAVLLATFAYATVRVQANTHLQRPDWRAVAHALGPATVPRAVLASDGTTADALKIYMPRVAWVQQPTRKVWIREVDVVGANKRLPLVPRRRVGPRALLEPLVYTSVGSTPPRAISVENARLLTRFHERNWVLARFALRRPARVSVDDLIALAPRYFRRTPQAVLVFFQRPARIG